jgi:hypothetical protein
MLLLAACNAQNAEREIPRATDISLGPNVVTLTIEVTQTHEIPTASMMQSTPVTLSSTPSPPAMPSGLTTVEPSFAKQPVIHDQPGDSYETIVSIPIGEDSLIQYEKHPESYQGPNALAVLPDESFMLADPVGERLISHAAAERIAEQ